MVQHPEMTDTVQFDTCTPGSISAKTIRRYRSRLRGSIIRFLNDEEIFTITQFAKQIAKMRDLDQTHARVQFSRPSWMHTSGEGIPVIQFDQLNVIAHHVHNIKFGEDLLPDNQTEWPCISPDTIFAAISKGLALPKLTRRKLLHDPSWPKFQKSEYVQLDKYYKQGMC
jgi:hypothetical protein